MIRNAVIFYAVVFALVAGEGTAQSLGKIQPASSLQLAQPAKRILACQSDSAGTGYRIWAVTVDGLMLQQNATVTQLSPPGARMAHAQTSRAQNRLAVLAQVHDAKSGEARWLLQIFRSSGSLQTAFALPLHRDEPFPVVQVTDRGERIFVANPAIATLRIFDGSGGLLREVRLFDDTAFDYERGLMLDVSADGRWLAVAAMATAARPQHPLADRNSHLWLFDRDGREQWRLTLPEQSLYALRMSDDSRFLAVASYDAYAAPDMIRKIRVFDRAGWQVQESHGLFDAARFDPEQQRLYFTDRRALRRLDLNTGEVHTLFSASGSAQKIVAMLLSPGRRHLAVAVAQPQFRENRFQFDQAQLFLISTDGRTRSALSPPEDELQPPFLLPVQGANRLAVTTKQTLHLIPWENDGP